MKKSLFIAVLIILKSGVSFSHENGTSSISGIIDEVKRYCSEANTSHSAQCLKAYLAYRCTVNHVFSDPLYVTDCISATADLVTELDLTQVDVDDVKNNSKDPLQLKQVAFSTILKYQFLKNPDSFAEIMKRYLDGFERSYRFDEDHSLWNRTWLDANQNKEEALKKMVTLFQDFASPGYLQHLETVALKSKNSYTRTTLLANTRAIADFYLPLIENRIKKNNNPKYSIYPAIPGVNEMTPLAHHFYTPAYLAMRLKRRGYSSQVSFYASFLFNTAYEFIKLDQKMKTKRWPLQDPLPFSLKKHDLQARKIYTGYLGALYGAGQSNQAWGYASFSKGLSDNPSGFVSRIHHSGF